MKRSAWFSSCFVDMALEWDCADEMWLDAGQHSPGWSTVEATAGGGAAATFDVFDGVFGLCSGDCWQEAVVFFEFAAGVEERGPGAVASATDSSPSSSIRASQCVSVGGAAARSAGPCLRVFASTVREPSGCQG